MPERTIRIWQLVIACVALIGFGQMVRGHTTIFMIGDSTMSDKPLEDNPERGWGQMLPGFFDSTVTVENHAMNGRSTRSFLAENRWQPILDKLKPGNYVIIQFGHNDEKPEKKDRYTPPEDYRRNLIKFVTEARGKEGIPVLCTPIVRRRFDSTGAFYDEHGVYPDIVREVATKYNVPLLDMHRKSRDLVVGLGPDSSKNIFIWVKPGVYKSLPQGREDNTHFCEYGATKMASIAVECMKEQKLDLVNHLRQ